MTVRNFEHRFSQEGNPDVFSQLSLSTADIAAAAVSEITQLALPSAPFGLFLDQLLAPNDPWFKWISQLGQVRETRTAFSGLFGRFVARAYLERHQRYQFFDPIRSDSQVLAGAPSLTVQRKQNTPGDLPDWVIARAQGANSFAIAEAKGSHNKAGPWTVLEGAKTQANRVEVLSGGQALTTKRWAIATRWAVAGNPSLNTPWLVVHDPDDGDRKATPAESAAVVRGVALRHFAALLDGMQMPKSARAVLAAVSAKPGGLKLPEQEQLVFAQAASPPQQGYAALVTRAGIIPIPPETDPAVRQAASQDLFGERAGVFAITADTILKIDAGGASTAAQSVEPTTDSFLARAQHLADGSQLFPSPDVRLGRTQV
jgi:hypothetical protein